MLEQNNFPSPVIDNVDVDPAMLIDDSDTMQNHETKESLLKDIQESTDTLNSRCENNDISNANNKGRDNLQNKIQSKSIIFSWSSVSTDLITDADASDRISDISLQLSGDGSYYYVTIKNPFNTKENLIFSFNKGGDNRYKPVQYVSIPNQSGKSLNHIKFVSTALKGIIQLLSE